MIPEKLRTLKDHIFSKILEAISPNISASRLVKGLRNTEEIYASFSFVSYKLK